MNKILVAYDGSPEADKALEHSISIAEDDDEIILLWVLPEPDTSFFADDLTLENAKSRLEIVMKQYAPTGLRITSKVLSGEIITEILRVSEELNCKLIVLGYKGVSKIGKFKLGNVSGEVAKRASKPVLIVK